MMNILRYFILTVSLLSFTSVYGPFAYAAASRYHSALALSDPQLKQLAEEFEQQILESPLVIHDPQANDYIRSLGKNLAKQTRHENSDDFHFYIVNSPEINAFAGPGGNIVINTGLILASESESELAAVMAHEISHVTQDHIYRSLQRTKNYKVPMIASALASIALGVVNPVLGSSLFAASLSGFNQDIISFTRSNEQEADRIGIRLLYNSDFDPQGMINFFEKFQMQSRYYYTDNAPSWLRTHPLDRERIADAQYRINSFTPKAYRNSVDYHFIRERVRNLTNTNNRKLLTFYQGELKVQPRNMALKYGYSEALLSSRQSALAIEQIAPVVDAFPNDINVQIALADIYMVENQPQYAQNILESLHNEDPENYPLMLTYSELLINVNQPHDATQILRRADTLYPNDPDIKFQLAKAQAADGNKAEAYFARADGLRIMGAYQQAFHQYQYALKLVGDNDQLLKARISARIDELS